MKLCCCGKMVTFVELWDEWLNHDPNKCEDEWKRENEWSGL